MQARAGLKSVFGVALLLGAGSLMSSATPPRLSMSEMPTARTSRVLELKSNGELTPVENQGGAGPRQARRLAAAGASAPTRSVSMSACATSLIPR